MRIRRLGGFLAILILCAAATASAARPQADACASPALEDAKTPQRLPFRLAGIRGWKETPDGFLEYNSETLYELINGGAEAYIARGMKRGLFQKMETADGKTYEALVMDFGNAKKSGVMFADKRRELSASSAVLGFDTSAVVARELPAGTLVFAAFGPYYFELTFSGYKTSRQGFGDAAKFLKSLRKKSTD